MKCFARGTERERDRERAKSFSLTADQDISPQINVMTHTHTYTHRDRDKLLHSGQTLEHILSGLGQNSQMTFKSKSALKAETTWKLPKVAKQFIPPTQAGKSSVTHTHTHLQSGILKSFADLPIVSATCVAIIHQNRRRHSPYTPLPPSVKDLELQTILKAFDVAANCVARAWPRLPPRSTHNAFLCRVDNVSTRFPSLRCRKNNA